MQALFGQVGRYAAFAAWFFRDAFLRYRARLILIGLANATGVALHTLAVLIAYRYAKALESGEAIVLAGFALQPRTSLGLLAATAVAAFVLAASAALLVMRARVNGAALALDYGEYCSQRIYSLVSRLSLSAQRGELADGTTRGLSDLARRDASYCAIVLRTIVYSLLHVATAVVAGAALLVLNLYLTLAVLAILAVAGFFLRYISIQAALQRAQLRRHLPEVARERRELRDRLVHTPAPMLPAHAALQRAFVRGAAAKVRRSTLAQRRALEGAKLTVQVAMGFAMFLVLVVYGGATLDEGANWSMLFIYVTALSFFGSSVVQVVRVLVSSNRFYPPLAAHARFVENAERELAAGEAAEVQGYRLQAPLAGEPGAAPLELRPGDRVALALPGDLTRLSMIVLGGALTPLGVQPPSARVAYPWFATAELAPGGGSLREELGLPAGCSLDELRAALAELGAPDGVVRLPPSLEQPLDAAQREALTPGAVFLLMALSGLLNRRSIVALDRAALAALEPRLQTALLDKAARGIVVLAGPAARAEQVGSHGESAVIIAGRQQVLGWARAQSVRAGDEAVLRLLARAAADARRPADERALGDDDLEELE